MALSRSFSRWSSFHPVPSTQILLPELHQKIKRFSSSEVDNVYDVVVVGAGLVGAAIACGFKNSIIASHLKVAILDRAPLAETLPPITEDYVPHPRVVSVTPSTVEFLKKIDGWTAEIEHRASAFESMQVWDTSGLGHVRYSAWETKASCLGHVVENDLLQAALHLRARDLGSMTILPPASLSSLDLGIKAGMDAGGELATLTLDNGAVVKAKLVIGADGARSRVRDLAGLRVWRRPYNQHAVVGTVLTSSPSSTAWQRFLPAGPLALLPVGGDAFKESGKYFSNVVWSTTPSHAAELAKQSPEDFSAAVDTALHSPPTSTLPGPLKGVVPEILLRVPELLHSVAAPLLPSAPAFEAPPRVLPTPGIKASFPLQIAHATRYVAPRVVLVGDAAHNVHPLAGQGVNLGFNDCQVLLNVIEEALHTGGDIGSVSTLKSYEHSQHINNSVMLGGLDGLQRLFDSENTIVELARAGGLRWINATPPVKRIIIDYAMGHISPSNVANEPRQRLNSLLGSLAPK
mmetsp:Transcript_21447/g.29808  ORF Transcript_21447/g.29808 Transcript_21447/m.29808 type:complete len:518 (+) Transcript_21447:157-1710(+)|eukprot:CAMPEP_0196588456 /NCGR_PEP_ID=MMETSP1081-20130531/60584_1 /TAXON_ID=36882 /ORGANISM="Pyramimonas amylifera, Strain CCMP720" /LENGTH=517 /DNA_ID=CAMNT_0041910955 /DNA_START=136 /DNA_END=1689 /DNA_ORIENTATION=-